MAPYTTTEYKLWVIYFPGERRTLQIAGKDKNSDSIFYRD